MAPEIVGLNCSHLLLVDSKCIWKKRKRKYYNTPNLLHRLTSGIRLNHDLGAVTHLFIFFAVLWRDQIICWVSVRSLQPLDSRSGWAKAADAQDAIDIFSREPSDPSTFSLSRVPVRTHHGAHFAAVASCVCRNELDAGGSAMRGTSEETLRIGSWQRGCAGFEYLGYAAGAVWGCCSRIHQLQGLCWLCSSQVRNVLCSTASFFSFFVLMDWLFFIGEANTTGRMGNQPSYRGPAVALWILCKYIVPKMKWNKFKRDRFFFFFF